MNPICGIYSPANPRGLDAMLGALAPGSPGGRWTSPDRAVGIGFAEGNVRSGRPAQVLAVDREAGLAVVADVRFDDLEGLRSALGARSPDCAHHAGAEAELVLRGWRRWGKELPRHLFGDYVFAVWDARKREMVCVRDPMGVKPCYYAWVPATGTFAFGSTLDAVLAAPGVSDEFDEAVVARALTCAGMDETRRTFFKDVRKLPPGHLLTLKVDTAGRPAARLARHWQPEQAPAVRRPSDDDYAEEFLSLFREAVAARLQGADPAGVHLSGGLDSSGIAVLAARELRRSGRPPPLAFSWLQNPEGTPPSEVHAPEYERIDAVCRQEQLAVFHRAPNAEDMVRVLRLDGTRPGVHVLASEEVVQRCAAERGVRVLLSGWGGDQAASFNGRGHHAHLLLRGRWGRLLSLGRARGNAPLRTLASAVLPLLPSDAHRWLQGRRQGFGGEPWLRRWFVDPDLAKRTHVRPKRWPRILSMRQAMLWLLSNGAIAERIEGWAAGGARHGIEYRYPLLDRRLLEFALGLPQEQFLRGEWDRWLMRHALRDILPASILWHRGKSDPARFDPMFDAFANALPLARQLLEERAAPPSRARYVDMPRLVERLDADHFRAEPRWVSIRTALQFLDF